MYIYPPSKKNRTKIQKQKKMMREFLCKERKWVSSKEKGPKQKNPKKEGKAKNFVF